MSSSNNPFIRGYPDLHIVRTLLITQNEEDSLPIWYPLHSSQAHLTDDQVMCFPCLIGDGFALVTEGQPIPEALKAQCHSEGRVRSVVYSVEGIDFDGKLIHVGDTYSEETAREVIGRLSFKTGFYSRCWEINSSHITRQAMHYLAELADSTTPTRSLFVTFRIPESDAIGIKLIATPWTDTHLRQIERITTEQLRQEHRRKGLPESLIEVLHLAACADVRLLVFDADALYLEGLKLYDTQEPL